MKRKVSSFILRIEALEEEWQCAWDDPSAGKEGCTADALNVAAAIDAVYGQAERAGFDKEAIKIIVEARKNGHLDIDPDWQNPLAVYSYLDEVEWEDPTMAEYPVGPDARMTVVLV